MKTAWCLLPLFLSIAIARPDPLHNLDFEDYNPTSGFVPGWLFETPGTSDTGPQILTRLPLWDGNHDGNPFWNPPSAWMMPGQQASVIPAPGKYTPLLVTFGTLSSWYVRQTGEIPADAKSMSFDLVGTQVTLKFNDANVPLQFISMGSPLVGSEFADISAFAGKTVAFEITVTGVTGFAYLDNIAFSSSTVPTIPEPVTLAISVAGVALAFLAFIKDKIST